MSFKYSVIIPTLNEEYFIEKNLRFLNSLNRNLEIIVSDGGSVDNTTAVAKKYNAQVINSDTGRGIQLNTGAKATNGDIFLFLHADTFLPKNAFDLLDEYFTNNENNICRFSIGFDFNHRLLDLYSSFSKYDTPFTRFGDSAVIVRKSFFENLK
jgi:glycosyltransferase involved in cell wall biosynthesis